MALPQAQKAIPKIEIDSEADIFGVIYRVWYGRQLLGTFYESPVSGWIAESLCSDSADSYETSSEAQISITEAWGIYE